MAGTPCICGRGHGRGGRIPRPVLSLSCAEGARREHPRSDRRVVHAAQLRERAVEPVLPPGTGQQPRRRHRRHAVHHPDRRAVCLLRRAAADRRQAGAAGARRPAAGAAVLRLRLCARADVRPRRRRHRGAARRRHPVRIDLRHEGNRDGLCAHALSLRGAADRRRVPVDRRFGRGGGAEPRRPARAHAAHRDPAAGAALDPCRRPPGVHRGAGEFRRAVRPRRGPADPCGRGLQAVRRRDRRQPGFGRRARRVADRLHGRGAGRAARPAGAAPLCDRRAAVGAAADGEPDAAPARHRLLLGRGRRRAGAVRGGGRDLVPRLQGAGPHLRPLARQFCPAVRALLSPARQHPAAGDARGSRRHADRRADRLRDRAASLAPFRRPRPDRDGAVRRRRHRARHRSRARLQQRAADPHRHRADHDHRLHGAEAAVLGARVERDPASDRRKSRGGLDQSRRRADANLPAHHRAADARRHRRRQRAHLRDGRLRAQLDRRALQRAVDHHDGRHVPGAGRHQRRGCGGGRDRADPVHHPAGGPRLSAAAAL